jgi:hypothetical protein
MANFSLIFLQKEGSVIKVSAVLYDFCHFGLIIDGANELGLELGVSGKL